MGEIAVSRGRPRDPGRDVLILEATASMLVQKGYEQLSVEAVAAAAGVGKTTIYRRFPDKAALVSAAVEARAASAPPRPRTGDLRSVLLELVEWLARQAGEQEGALLGGM